jgi:hypothetical protein
MIDWAARASAALSQKRGAPTDKGDKCRLSSALSVLDGPADDKRTGVSSVSSVSDWRFVADRRFAALVKAINQCCAARGDTEANCAALIAECAELTPAEQTDMTEHFNVQTAIWQRAARGGGP